MARRKPAPASRAVVALCVWEDYNYAGRLEGSATYDQRAPMWTTYGEDEPTACRASLGGRILTVWLPKGAAIRCRVHSDTPMASTYTHVYGSHERMSRARIRIRLTELPRT
jgi:hypothetical protein